MKRQKAMEAKLGRPLSTLQSTKKKDNPNAEWEDVDEHEKDVFEKDGYYDVMEEDEGICADDLKLLEKFNKGSEKLLERKGKLGDANEDGPSGGVNFADLICAKLESGDYVDGNDYNKHMQGQVDDMDPKIVQTYQKIGIVMKTFRSGKLPKAFKVIPMVQNWEELLFLTKPETWSPNATFEATKIFASTMTAKIVQRFYSLILAPAVRNNIAQFKKLNVHLYNAVKKSIFKTGAFFKGFLLPLAEDASAREAVIIGSILAKCSINTLDAAAATMKLAQMPYRIGSGFFLKTMLAKKYALPTVVVTTLVDFFCRFETEGYTNDDD